MQDRTGEWEVGGPAARSIEPVAGVTCYAPAQAAVMEMADGLTMRRIDDAMGDRIAERRAVNRFGDSCKGSAACVEPVTNRVRYRGRQAKRR